VLQPRGQLDLPPSRWRVVLRRLPITLAVLLTVGGAAAGLAYVASGSGTHGFPARLTNDLGETVEVGPCAESDCRKGGSLGPQSLAADQELTVGLRTGRSPNPFLITTLAGVRVGCLFLRYAKEPPEAPLVPLSRARRC
jgi:hypothetical protein